MGLINFLEYYGASANSTNVVTDPVLTGFGYVAFTAIMVQLTYATYVRSSINSKVLEKLLEKQDKSHMGITRLIRNNATEVGIAVRWVWALILTGGAAGLLGGFLAGFGDVVDDEGLPMNVSISISDLRDVPFIVHMGLAPLFILPTIVFTTFIMKDEKLDLRMTYNVAAGLVSVFGISYMCIIGSLVGSFHAFQVNQIDTVFKDIILATGMTLGAALIVRFGTAMGKIAAGMDADGDIGEWDFPDT